MRKTCLGLFSAAILGLSLSSCLGDGGEQSITSQNEFGVIKVVSESGVSVTAATMARGVNITGGDITGYSAGDVVLVSYKANLNDFINSTTIKAEYATIDASSGVFKVANQVSVTEGSVGDNTPSASTAFTGFTSKYGNSAQTFSNRWLVSVSANIRKDQEIRGIELYYDENDQTLPANLGLTLPEDAIVLDVKLLKTTPTSESTDAAVKSKDIAVDLTSLRRLNPKQMSETATGKTLYIWLRYPKYTTSDQKYAVAVMQNAFGITYYTTN